MFQIDRIDSQPPCLCTKCGSKLDLAYDFVLKLRSSTNKIKQHKYQIAQNEDNSNSDDPLRVIDLNPAAPELTLVTKIMPLSSARNFTVLISSIQNYRDGENAQQTEYFIITKVKSFPIISSC